MRATGASRSGARPTRRTSPACRAWSPTTCCCRSSRSPSSCCSSPAGCWLAGAAGLLLADLQRIFPTAADTTLSEGIRRCRRPRRRRDRGRSSPRLVRLVVLGRAGHRVLPHLPLRVPHLGPARRSSRSGCSPSCCCSSRRRSRCRRCSAARLGRARPPARALRRQGIVLRDEPGRSAWSLLFATLCAIYRRAQARMPWARVWPGAIGATAGDRRRRPRLPALPRRHLPPLRSAPRLCSS